MEIPVSYFKVEPNPEYESTKPFGSVPRVFVVHNEGTMIGTGELYVQDMDMNSQRHRVPAAVILTKDNKFELIELTKVTKREEE